MLGLLWTRRIIFFYLVRRVRKLKTIRKNVLLSTTEQKSLHTLKTEAVLFSERSKTEIHA
jgi:hypothetical protein